MVYSLNDNTENITASILSAKFGITQQLDNVYLDVNALSKDLQNLSVELNNLAVEEKELETGIRDEAEEAKGKTDNEVIKKAIDELIEELDEVSIPTDIFDECTNIYVSYTDTCTMCNGYTVNPDNPICNGYSPGETTETPGEEVGCAPCYMYASCVADVDAEPGCMYAPCMYTPCVAADNDEVMCIGDIDWGAACTNNTDMCSGYSSDVDGCVRSVNNIRCRQNYDDSDATCVAFYQRDEGSYTHCEDFTKKNEDGSTAYSCDEYGWKRVLVGGDKDTCKLTVTSVNCEGVYKDRYGDCTDYSTVGGAVTCNPYSSTSGENCTTSFFCAKGYGEGGVPMSCTGTFTSDEGVTCTGSYENLGDGLGSCGGTFSNDKGSCTGGYATDSTVEVCPSNYTNVEKGITCNNGFWADGDKYGCANGDGNCMGYQEECSGYNPCTSSCYGFSCPQCYANEYNPGGGGGGCDCFGYVPPCSFVPSCTKCVSGNYCEQCHDTEYNPCTSCFNVCLSGQGCVNGPGIS